MPKKLIQPAAAGAAAAGAAPPKQRRGFASMPTRQVRAIASQGGVAVSRDREHMREIGRIGGANRLGRNRKRDGRVAV